jgi:hypothetical protein
MKKYPSDLSQSQICEILATQAMERTTRQLNALQNYF